MRATPEETHCISCTQVKAETIAKSQSHAQASFKRKPTHIGALQHGASHLVCLTTTFLRIVTPAQWISWSTRNISATCTEPCRQSAQQRKDLNLTMINESTLSPASPIPSEAHDKTVIERNPCSSLQQHTPPCVSTSRQGLKCHR